MKDEGVTLVLRLGLKAAMGHLEEKVVKEIIDECFGGNEQLTLDEWVAAAKQGNEAVLSFLNPGGLVQ